MSRTIHIEIGNKRKKINIKYPRGVVMLTDQITKSIYLRLFIPISLPHSLYIYIYIYIYIYLRLFTSIYRSIYLCSYSQSCYYIQSNHIQPSLQRPQNTLTVPVQTGQTSPCTECPRYNSKLHWKVDFCSRVFDPFLAINLKSSLTRM